MTPQLSPAEVAPVVQGPKDPWGPEGEETLRPPNPLLTVQPDPERPYRAAQALQEAASTTPQQPQTVKLYGGYTAIIERPNKPDHKGGEGNIYFVDVHHKGRAQSLGRYALKRVPLSMPDETSQSSRAPSANGGARSKGTSLHRQTQLMKFAYAKSLFRNGRPGLPWTITHGRDKHWEYMLQDIVPGETLAKHISAGRELPVLQIMSDLLMTVAATEDDNLPANGYHADIARYGGLIFQDLKPSNVMFDPATGVTRIIDGGTIHGRLQRDRKPQVYEGTYLWMTPEQWHYSKQNLQTNQYLLALIWLELRTNGGYSKMRQDMNPKETSVAFGYQTVNDLHMAGVKRLMAGHNIPLGEQRIMLRALQNDPSQRWPNTEAMYDELVHYRYTLAVRSIGATANQVADPARITIAEQPTAPMQSIPKRAVRGRVG